MDKDKNPQKTGPEAPRGKTVAGGAPPAGSAALDDKPARGVPVDSALPQDQPLQDKPAGDAAAADKSRPDTRSQDKSPGGKPVAGGPSPARAGAGESSSVERPASGKAPPAQPASPATARKAGTPTAEKPRRGGKGKWLALLVLIALVASGYYLLWPVYGDRVMAFSGQVTGGDAAQPSQPETFAGDEGQGGGELASEPDAQPAGDDFASSPAFDELFDAERSARQDMATELRDGMADLQLQLNSHADRLRQLSTTSREDWLLAEAEYLLRLASQRLLTERQTTNAAALMESADVILRDMSDPALYPVRKALAEDITRVRMAEPVDREGIFLRIGALVDVVDNLDSLLPDPGAAPPVIVAPQPVSWHGRLLANIRQAAANMVGLIRVERRDVPLQPLLTLEQEQVLRYNLKVVLEQARLALLREEQSIYADSLSRASTWIGEHFEDNARTAAFVTELDQLAAQRVSQELPSVTPSLQALQAYIRLWHNRHDPGIPPDSSGAAQQDGSDSP